MQSHVFEFQSSRYYAFFLFMLIFLCVVSIVMTPIHWLYQAGCLCVLFIYAYYLHRRQREVEACRFEADHCLICVNHIWLPVSLRGETFLSSLVSVLCFDQIDAKQRYYVTVWRDALPADTYRRLLAVVRYRNEVI